MSPEVATIIGIVITGTFGVINVYLAKRLNRVKKTVADHQEMAAWWRLKKNRKIFVFIIDDNDDDIKLIERIVKETGNQYKSFNNEDDALDNIPEDPQVVILDYYLFKRTGLQMLREIKIKNPLHVVIVLSGSSDPTLKMLFWDEGALSYIEKNEANYQQKIKMAINRAVAIVQNI